MITIGQGSARLCSGVTRRDFLRAGGIGLGSLGLSLGELNALASDRPDSDRAVILLMLVGGPSQLETFDPKPDAPEEIRGPFRSIATRVPGIRIGEHLPRLAARMDRFALIRSHAPRRGADPRDRPSASPDRAALPIGRGAPAPGFRGGPVARSEQRPAARHARPRPDHGHGGESAARPDRGMAGGGVRAVPRRGRSRVAVLRSRPRARPGPASPRLDLEPHAGFWPGSRRTGRSPAGTRRGPHSELDAERNGSARRLRTEHVRPELPAGSAAGRSRRAAGHGEHVRDRVQQGHLGLPRFGAVQHARRLRPGAAADARPGPLGAPRRSPFARAARFHDGRRDRRVRPDPQAQCRRRPRPLAGCLERDSWPAEACGAAG